MLGAVGKALYFLSLLAVGVITGAYLLTYAAHCFLVVLQGTAAGQDEVSWPDEPLFDRLLQALHLLGLAAIWLVPAGILWRGLRHDLLPDDGLLRFLVVVGPVFWLTFPFGVLSSLSGNLRWVPVRWVIFRQMLLLLPATAAFYAATALLVGAVAAAWYFALAGDRFYLIPVAALLTGAGCLIYPRLLGRLAWLVGRHLPAPAAPEPKAPLPVAGAKKKLPRPRPRGRLKGTKVEDPWKVPDDFEAPPPAAKPRNPNLPPSAHEIEPYGLSTDDDPAEPRPLPKRRPPGARGMQPPSAYEIEAYKLDPEPAVKPVFFPPPDPSEPAVPPPPGGEAARGPGRPDARRQSEPAVPPPPGGEDRAESKGPAPGVEVSELEMRLAQRPKPPPLPAHPLVSGVYNFPGYVTSRQAWFRLSLSWFVLGVLVYQLVAAFRELPE
jgi:hypothetical protein